jgi:tetratricopeptide (TPR) repeat protein
VLLFASVTPTQAQITNADFQQAVAAYQQSPSAGNAEKVIRMAAALPQLPPIPEEARRHFVRGTALFKDAKSPGDFKQAIDEFQQAVRLAPWWPDARYNFALAEEAIGNYAWAIDNIKLYLLFNLPDADARAAQDKIYAIEAKQEKAAKAKEEENSPQAAAAREQKKYEDWLRRIDGRRYTFSNEVGEHIIDIKGRFLVLGIVYAPALANQASGFPAGYQFKERIEIQGRVATKPIPQWGVSYTYAISDDGEKIHLHVPSFIYQGRSIPGEDYDYFWQR